MRVLARRHARTCTYTHVLTRRYTHKCARIHSNTDIANMENNCLGSIPISSVQRQAALLCAWHRIRTFIHGRSVHSCAWTMGVRKHCIAMHVFHSLQRPYTHQQPYTRKAASKRKFVPRLINTVHYIPCTLHITEDQLRVQPYRAQLIQKARRQHTQSS